MEEYGRDQIGDDYAQDQPINNNQQQQQQERQRRHSFSAGQQPGGMKRRRNRTLSPSSSLRRLLPSGNNITLPQQWQREKKKKKKKHPTNSSSRPTTTNNIPTPNYRSLTSSNLLHQNENHQNDKGSMSVVHVPSIVGSRPLGWGKRHQRTVATSGGGGGGSQSLQHHLQNRPMTKVGALAAATRTPLATKRIVVGSSADNPNNNEIEPNKLWDGRSPMISKITLQEQVIAEASDGIHRTASSPINNTRPTTKSISFTPSFLPSSSSANKTSSVLQRRNNHVTMDDGTGVDDFEDNETTTNRRRRIQQEMTPMTSTYSYDGLVSSSSHQFSSPLANNNNNNNMLPTNGSRSRRTPSSSKNRMGPLAQRFAYLLKQRSNDLVRLQNPAFTRSSFDLNDPRKRAKSYTDITILGQGGWTKGNDGNTNNNNNNTKKLAVLVYVHHHVLKKQQYYSTTTTTTENDTNNTSSLVGGEKEGILAWACFDLSTVRAIVGGQLRGGISLRLYNAQFIPSRYPVRIDPNSIIFHHRPATCTTTTPTTGVQQHHQQQQQQADTVCNFFIVCTSLCEMYPQELEPLPEVSMILPTT